MLLEAEIIDSVFYVCHRDYIYIYLLAQLYKPQLSFCHFDRTRPIARAIQIAAPALWWQVRTCHETDDTDDTGGVYISMLVGEKTVFLAGDISGCI